MSGYYNCESSVYFIGLMLDQMVLVAVIIPVPIVDDDTVDTVLQVVVPELIVFKRRTLAHIKHHTRRHQQVLQTTITCRSTAF